MTTATRAADDAIERMRDRHLRAVGAVVAVAGIAGLLVVNGTGADLGFPTPTYNVLTSIATMAGLATLLIDPQRWRVGRRPGMAIVLVVIVLAATVALDALHGPIILAALVLVPMIIIAGVLVDPRAHALIVATVSVAEIVIAWAADGHDWSTAIGFTVMAIPLSLAVRRYDAELVNMVRAQTTATAAATAQADDFARVAAASRDIHVLEDRAVLDALVDAAAGLGWSVCGVYLPAEDGGPPVLTAGRGHATPVPPVPRPDGLFAEVIETRATVIRDHYETHPGANPQYPQIRAAIGVPIQVGGRTIGGIVAGRERTGIRPVDVGLLELLAAQAGGAMETLHAFRLERRATRDAERISQIKDDVIATVSHELRTPLQVILGMAATLDDHWARMEPEVGRQLVARLHHNAAELSNLVEVLLDFALLDGDAIAIDPTPIDISQMVEQAAATVRDLHPDHPLTVDTSDGRSAVIAAGDETLLGRVVDNLLANACRHTAPGTPVRVEVREADGDAVVTVHDAGPGIRPDVLARLGERFYRGDEHHLRRGTRGAGLGLAFCREVLALHGTRLECSSTVGVGSTFGFRLPGATRVETVTARPTTADRSDDSDDGDTSVQA